MLLKLWCGRAFRVLLWIFIAICVLLLLLTTGLNAYLSSDKSKIFDDLSFLNKGSVTFDKAHVSIIREFPKASLVFDNIKITHGTDDNTIISAKEIVSNLSLEDWKNKNFTLQNVSMTSAVINLELDKEAPDYFDISNLLGAKSEVKHEAQEQEVDGEKKFSFATGKLQVKLDDGDINVTDSSKGLVVDVFLDRLETQLDRSTEGYLFGAVELDLRVDTLKFSNDSGAFLTNANLEGEFKVEQNAGGLTINAFPLHINQHLFNVSTKVSTQDPKGTQIILHNKETDLQKIVALLPEKISDAVAPYYIEEPFVTTTHLAISPGKPVVVDVDFIVRNSPVSIEGNAFDDATVTGRFVNTKSDRTSTINNKGIRLMLDEALLRKGDFLINSDNAVITAGGQIAAQLMSSVQLSGPASAISEWYESDQFYFESGSFKLNTDVNGRLNNISQLLLTSQTELEIQDVNIRYVPTDILLPVHALNLDKVGETAIFSLLTSAPISNNEISLEGEIRNVTSLLEDEAETPTESKVVIKAARLGWEDYLSLFSKDKIIKEESGIPTTSPNGIKNNSLSTMRKTLIGIDKKFGPEITIAIDTFDYLDVISVYDFRMKVDFDENNNIRLENTTVELDQGGLTVDGHLDISQLGTTEFSIAMTTEDVDLEDLLPRFDYFNVNFLKQLEYTTKAFDLTVNVNGKIDDDKGILTNTLNGDIAFATNDAKNLEAKISFKPYVSHGTDDHSRPKFELSSHVDLSGNPHAFNDFFKNDNFFFQDTGRFTVSFDYEGNVKDVQELIETSDLVFEITDGAVYSKDIDIIFPLTKLDLGLSRDTADFNLFMYSEIIDREINLEGNLKNLTELIFKNTGKKLSSVLNAYSPILNLNHLTDIFTNELKQEENAKKSTPKEAQQKMRTFVLSLLGRFDPDINLNLGTFVINDSLKLDNLYTGVSIQDSSILILEQTDFKFYETEIGFDAKVDMTNPTPLPFDMYLRAKRLNLAEFLHSLGYLGSNSLRNAKVLEGLISLDMKFAGEMHDLKLVQPKNDAEILFVIEKLQMKGVDVIDDVADKILLRSRLSSLQFGPIENTIEITGTHIDIPLMEIQSDAFDFFVEGYIDNETTDPDKMTDVWVSIPYNNISKRTVGVVPEKRGWAATKAKLHLQLSKKPDSSMRKRLRLSKRQFYKDRGLMKAYKAGKRHNRTIRKEQRLALKKS